MISIQSKAQFIDEEHDQAVVAVQTSKCFYRVAIQGDMITVVGPGLEESIFIGNHISDDCEHLTYEGLAVIAVTYFEERNR